MNKHIKYGYKMIQYRKYYWIKCDDGATAIEYGLLAALVVLALIASIGSIGDAFIQYFDYVSAETAALPTGEASGETPGETTEKTTGTQ